MLCCPFTVYPLCANVSVMLSILYNNYTKLITRFMGFLYPLVVNLANQNKNANCASVLLVLY